MGSVVPVDEEEGVSREEEAGPCRAERKALLLAVSGEQEAVGLPADIGPWRPRSPRGTLGPHPLEYLIHPDPLEYLQTQLLHMICIHCPTLPL